MASYFYYYPNVPSSLQSIRPFDSDKFLFPPGTKLLPPPSFYTCPFTSSCYPGPKEVVFGLSDVNQGRDLIQPGFEVAVGVRQDVTVITTTDIDPFDPLELVGTICKCRHYRKLDSTSFS